MVTIRPEAWYAQWVNAPHRFDFNLWNFEVEMAKKAVEVFTHSFDIGRFNSEGAPAWRKTGKTNKGGHPVGSLIESSSLRNSIKWKPLMSTGTSRTVQVYTDPSAFGNTFRHKGFCFAAVHNDGIGRFPQRQFMPTGKKDSSVMNDERKQLEMKIFQGLPARKIR